MPAIVQLSTITVFLLQLLLSILIMHIQCHLAMQDKYQLPRITQHPQSQVATNGNKITFKCDYDVVDAHTQTNQLAISAFVQIKWLFNLNDIQTLFNTNDYITDKNRLILLSYDSTRHNGEYRCLVNNTLISWAVLSEPANLSLAFIDQMDQAKENEATLTMTEGNVAIIQCKLPASNPPAVPVFVLNNTILIDDDIPRYKIFPSGNLQISDLRMSDSGVYTCSARNSVTNELRNNTRRTSLRIGHRTAYTGTQVPDILHAPADANRVQIGANLTLECVASGVPVPTITWEKFGGVLPAKRSQQVFGNLLLTNIQQEDRGTYVCRAENGPGQATFRTAMVDVFEAPSLVNMDNSTNSSPPSIYKYYANRNDQIELKCPLRWRPKADVQWFFNGRLINQNDRNCVIGDRSITIKMVSHESIGSYQCYARNDYGYKQAQLVLYFNDDRQTSSYAKDSTTTQQTSRTTETGDQSAAVLQHNTYGQRPSILIGPQNVTLFEGQTIVLLCVTDANAQINWLKNDIIIEPSLMRRYEINQVGNLRIVSAQSSDAGLYKCIASNEFGMSTAEGFVFVKDEETKDRATVVFKTADELEQTKKSSKKNPVASKPLIEQIDKDKILLKWNLIAMHDMSQNLNDDNDPAIQTIDYFKIEYRIMSSTMGQQPSQMQNKPKANQWITIDEQIDVNKREYILTDLSPVDYYRFRINTIMKNGYQTHGQQSVKFKLDDTEIANSIGAQPLASPKNMSSTSHLDLQLTQIQIKQVWAISESSLAIKWQMSNKTSVAPIDGFYIYYRKVDNQANKPESKNTYQIMTLANNPLVDTFAVTNLDAASTYEIKMTCYSQNRITCDTSNTMYGLTHTSNKVAVVQQQSSPSSTILLGSTKQNEILFMVLGIVLGVLTLLLVLFVVLCVMRQRQHKNLLAKLNTSNKLTGSSCPTLIYDDCVRTTQKVPFFPNLTDGANQQGFLILQQQQQHENNTNKPPIPNVPPPQLANSTMTNRQQQQQQQLFNLNINPLGYLDPNNVTLNYIKQQQQQQQHQQQQSENFYHTLNTITHQQQQQQHNDDYNNTTLNLRTHFLLQPHHMDSNNALISSLQRASYVAHVHTDDPQHNDTNSRSKRSFKRTNSTKKAKKQQQQQQQGDEQIYHQTAILIPAHIAQNLHMTEPIYQSNKFLLNSNYLYQYKNSALMTSCEQQQQREVNNLLAANSNSNSSGIGSTSSPDCNDDVLHEETVPFINHNLNHNPQNETSVQQCATQSD